MKTLPFVALTCGLLAGPAAAQTAPLCEDTVLVSSRIVSRDTVAAVQRVDRLVGQAGPDADLRGLRRQVLSDEFPRADVDLVIDRMLRSFCHAVESEPGLSEAQKLERVQQARQDMLRPVQGPSELARTNSRIRTSVWPPLRLAHLPASLHRVADLRGPMTPQPPAADTAPPGSAPAGPAPAVEDEFLRDPPAYVNDSNKYFVIVGSARSEDSAIALMNRLKRKAPAYDFVVYRPYGGNPSYGVMMATWVSRTVANEALRVAREEVVPDAFIWACRSAGESC